MCGLVRQSLPDEKAILPFFKPWLAQTTDYLAQFPADGLSGPQLWERWKACRAGWLADPALAPRVALMEAALPAIPQVLTGRRKATDVLFPGGSLADAFNGVLAEHVARFAAAHASGGGLRILEIGAGTGGTTHHVLERLKPFEKAISEYCYTDRSHSFLQHGERQYGAGRGFFACRLLDIEKPAEEQGFAPGSYDLVIAANVLHATRDMRATMRNVHSLLRPDGLLAMNELSGNALYAHLSFGLLEGWWRYDDAALRMPGSPGLAPGSWAALLAEEGFTGVSFPAEDSHALGQQIILARNAASLAAADAGPVEDRLGAVEATIRAHVARSLKIAPERIENDRSFSDYGVDSILAVNLVNDIAEAVGAPLTTTVIFDYNTVERLARHVIETYPGSGSSAAVPDAAPAPLFDGRMRAVLQAFEEADLGPQETVLLLTGRPDVADLGERVARERGIDLIVAAPSPSMRGWLSQPRGCRGLALDGPEFGKRLLAFNQRRKVDHIICDLPDVAEDLSQILRDGGQWLDVG
jgi:polyketide synthase PksN